MSTHVKRNGFTLLEVTLATSIALLLMYGLYVAIDVELKYAAKGREQVGRATLARSLFARIENDLAPSIGVPDPGRFRQATTEQEAAQGGTGDTGIEGDPAAEMPEEEPETGSVAGDDPSSAKTVVGTQEELIVYVSRIPREAYVENSTVDEQTLNNNPTEEIISDQRRIRYWLDRSGDDSLGLARVEQRLTASSLEDDPLGLNGLDSGLPGEYVIAPEVVELEFAYWDRELPGWVNSWDGREPYLEGDANIPKGAPAAIRVTLKVRLPTNDPNAPERYRTFRHTIHVPTADGVKIVTDEMTTP